MNIYYFFASQRREKDGYADLGDGPPVETPPYRFIGSFGRHRNRQQALLRAYVSEPSWIQWDNLSEYSKAMADDINNFMLKNMKPKMVVSNRELKERSTALILLNEWTSNESFDVDYFLDRGVDRYNQHWVLAVWQPTWMTLSKKLIYNPQDIPEIYSDEIDLNMSKSQRDLLSK